MLGWVSFIIILGLSTYWIYVLSKNTSLSSKLYIAGFYVKLCFAISYVLLFTYYFSDGKLYGDSYRFIYDSYAINQLAYSDFSAYLNLLFGNIDITNAQVIKALSQTHIWDYGENGDWINDNRLILKINSLIHFVSFKNIYVHALIFSLISFLGIHLIYRTFENFIGNKKAFWIMIIAFPNFAFWSSAILKESIFIFGIGLFVFYVFKWINKQKSIIYIVFSIVGCLLLLFNKPYAGLFIILFSLTYILGAYLNWKIKGLIISTILIGFLAIIVIFIPSRLNITSKISTKQTDLNNLGKGGIAFINDTAFCVFDYQLLNSFEIVEESKIKVKDTIVGECKLFGQSKYNSIIIHPSSQVYDVYLIYPPSTSYSSPVLINHSPVQLLLNIPQALVNTVIRPFPWDNGDPLKIINFISNLFFLVFIIYIVRNKRKLTNQEKYILYFLIGSALFILLIVGLTVPIFGAIVRYKIPAELLIIISGFIILKPKHET